ncbi:MAG: hypothetical protein RL762_1279 [Bacteroidota bacterium]
MSNCIEPWKGVELCERAFGLEGTNLQDLMGGNDLASIELPIKFNSPRSSGHE